LKLCLNDPNVDGVIVIYTPQGAALPNDLAEAVVNIIRETEWVKPVLAVMVGGESLAEARRIFHENDVPTYETPEQAVKTYIYMYKYKRNLELLYETPEDLPIDPSPPKNFLKLLVKKALNEGRYVLGLDEANKFLDVYGIPRPEGELVSSVEEAVAAARRIGYPVALKAVSPKIVHKTDVGGVVLNISSEEMLRKAFVKMNESLKTVVSEADVRGFYVQRMVEPVHYELIIGSKKDPDFGSVIMFGAGGIATEFMKDTAVGLPPLNQVLARRIVEETKIHDVLLKGLRNKPPANLRKIEETIVRFSNIIVDFPEIKEAEINPLMVAGDKVSAADCRIVLDPGFQPSEEPYQHLVISPYPTKYVRPWRLKDGRTVLLRPIKPEDEPIEYELIKGLSEESSRFRFFQVIREITHEMLVRFCNIDYDREMAIIAEYREDGKVRNVGVGRLIIDPDRRRAEFAVLVADDFQGLGLGTKLVDTLIEIATEKKISTVYGIILPENTRMINLARKMGFTVKRRSEDVYVELKLDTEKPVETKPKHRQITLETKEI
ncbi:MAG: GNAT family N-acetyltransferase, partial [Candidatus Caldarchaeum sp.]|nr:GNAT family N-acetyltransferase [Candidatus Caldarchaeum sp.]